MINTITIHYDYDENDGILPSGLPRGPAYCDARCPHLFEDGRCDLFQDTVERVRIGKDARVAYIPAALCTQHEVQGR